MGLGKIFRKGPGFYVEIAVFSCLVFAVSLFCFIPGNGGFLSKNKENIFKASHYLYSNSKIIDAVQTFDFNISGGIVLGYAGPPFLVSSKSFSSLNNFSPAGEIANYIVEQGDSLGSIAERFGLSLETILWANNLSSKSVLKPGQKLVILPVSGVLHMVSPGDTLSEIAALYKVDIEEIVKINGLADPADIYSGDMLIIPGAEKPKRLSRYVRVPLPGNYFICPIPSPCRITQGLHWYNAVDFSNGRCGEPVYAAAGGTVQRTGYGKVSGYYVRIVHSNKVVTFYGHLSKIAVKPGQRVYQGQILGYIGHSGFTVPAGPAGCHLHFDVRFAANPFAIYRVGTQLGK